MLVCSRGAKTPIVTHFQTKQVKRFICFKMSLELDEWNCPGKALPKRRQMHWRVRLLSLMLSEGGNWSQKCIVRTQGTSWGGH